MPDTAKLALHKAIDTDSVDYEVDIGDAFDKIDDLLPTKVCTSGARPGTPFTGQTIFESDTLNLMVYTGARWWPVNASYDTAAARDTALASPQEGMLVWIENTNVFTYYNGTVWAELYKGSATDTGWVNTDTGFSNVDVSLWAFVTGSLFYRINGNVASIRGEFQRKTSTFATTADGNPSNQSLINVPAALIPTLSQSLGTYSTGILSAYTISSGGVISVVSFIPSQTIAVDQTGSFCGTYFL